MDNVKIIENTDQAKDEYGYMWGADTFYLTIEMIEALLNGKCIAGDNGEYVTFIEMNKNSRGEQSSYPCFSIISITHEPIKAFSENDKWYRHYRFKCAILSTH